MITGFRRIPDRAQHHDHGTRKTHTGTNGETAVLERSRLAWVNHCSFLSWHYADPLFIAIESLRLGLPPGLALQYNVVVVPGMHTPVTSETMVVDS